jgi:hypothetical protein
MPPRGPDRGTAAMWPEAPSGPCLVDGLPDRPIVRPPHPRQARDDPAPATIPRTTIGTGVLPALLPYGTRRRSLNAAGGRDPAAGAVIQRRRLRRPISAV